MITRAERMDLPSGEESGDESKLVARWRVYSDDRYDGPEHMLAYNGLPKYGTYWIQPAAGGALSYNYAFRCVNRACEMVSGSPFQAILTNTYSSKFDAQELENKAKELKPSERTPKISRRYVEIDEPLVKDAISEEIIRNTAGDPIIGLRTKRIQVVYDLEGYFLLDPQWLETINGCMNKYASVIYGRTWAAHQLRFNLQSISPLLFDKGEYYYTVKAQLVGELRSWGHKQHILNAGLREKDFFGGNALRTCRVNDVDVTQPVPLDANGYMIPTATLRANPVTAPVYLDVAGFEEADFSVIGLPPTTYQPEN